MRFRTLEIRWHDSKAISTCDFQPIPVFKKARPPGLGSSDVSQQEWTEKWASQSYRLATGGDDNHVRVWMVHPNIRPTTAAAAAEASTSTTQTAPRPPRIEYLATLSKHSAPVNVVRWSPNGETMASAGDDGMIIIWAPSSTPQASAYGSDVNPDEMSNEKEFWKPRIMVRCTTMEVYDLAWSPTSEYIIAGSTDNAARIFHAADGKCIHEIADHTHFVQGVSWDPLNEYIATQSSDRAMHVHRVTHNHHGGSLEVHAVGKNSHMSLQTGSHTGRGRARKHARTSSVVSNTSHTEGGRESSRPRFSRRESMTSDVESVFEESGATTSSALFSSATPELPKEKEFKDPTALPHSSNAPLTPCTSVASTPIIPPIASALPPLTVPPITTSLSSGSTSSMLPPPSTPIDKEKGHVQPSSRRSSFSNASNAPASPAFSVSSRFGRSPSPMPALPAIRTAVPSSHSYPTPNSRTGTDQWKNIGLYGDESYTNFFRRLTFSPDGALLVTPAGQFEDPEVVVLPTPASEEGSTTPARGRKGRHEEAAAGNSSKGSDNSSCVYIYTRANFAKPPIATLPGHKKASVAVKFNPVLIELREGVTSTQEGSSAGRTAAPKTALLSNEVSQLDVDVVGPIPSQPSQAEVSNTGMGMTLLPSSQRTTPTIASPSPRHASAADPAVRPLTPAASKPGTPSQHHLTPAMAPSTPSVFALPYRMLFAVITMDAVVIYDTQQSSPVCILTKLHYDEFTDASWSPDGQSLMLSSRDGYCTLIVFDEIFPAYHKQQQALQLQSIAQQHSVPITNVGLPPAGSSSTGFVRSVTPSPTPTAVRARVNAIDRPPTPSAANTSDTDAGGPSVKRGRESEESNNTPDNEKAATDQPPKKKRRVALTRVGDLGS
ncbi:chromatin assembly complex protein [Moniliophthora roreri MCA 2997]|uniref:Chromatin assembly complex protein n=1 Tax=Moniliophthora roreri (strain MCA 2997) TaxID=1381753 RepID=V2X2D3_MONRO|nr:chromatin assembly complex protein [Moniliophthora roreri MCA 2997]